jgi:hypothetical protein
MSSKKGIHFTLDIPRKRERNILVLKQAMCEAQTPQKMSTLKHKKERNPRAWEDEDWGEDF